MCEFEDLRLPYLNTFFGVRGEKLVWWNRFESDDLDFADSVRLISQNCRTIIVSVKECYVLLPPLFFYLKVCESESLL